MCENCLVAILIEDRQYRSWKLTWSFEYFHIANRVVQGPFPYSIEIPAYVL